MLLITALSFCLLSSSQELIVTTTQEPPMDMAAFGNVQLAVDADEPRGGEREIMPCDLGPTIVGNRGTVWGTLWPDGLVYYDFDASISQLNRFRTREAMDVLEAAAGTVFIPRTNEPNYIHIIEAGGNWSWIGMIGGSQNLSMYNWDYQLIICHELIHALGRLHQQSRSDRDNYITVNWECIETEYADQYNICNQCPNWGDYDFESVMHYSQWGFSNGCPTMTCLPGYEEYQDVMGQREYLSDGDIETLQFMYPLSITGACCTDTIACIEITEDACASIDGTYFGDGNTCASAECMPQVYIDYPDGKPSLLDPYGTSVAINFLSGTTEPAPDSGNLHLSVHGGAWEEIPLVPATESDYVAVFPYYECEETIEWYISVDTVDGDVVQSPYNAPENTWSADVFSGRDTVFFDNFEMNMGWLAISGAETGNWQRVVPSGNGDFCEPATAVGGSGMCFLTGNNYHEDVDNGMTMLYSPSITIDMDKAPTLSYYRWYSNGANCNGSNAYEDMMLVDLTLDNGNTFTSLEVVGPDGEDAEGGWRYVEFDLQDYLKETGVIDLRVLYTVGDEMNPSVVEAGVDNVMFTNAYCSACYWADVNRDGGVGVTDLLMVIDQWGTDGIADVNGDGTVNVSDLLAIVDAWGPCTY